MFLFQAYASAFPKMSESEIGKIKSQFGDVPPAAIEMLREGKAQAMKGTYKSGKIEKTKLLLFNGKGIFDYRMKKWQITDPNGWRQEADWKKSILATPNCRDPKITTWAVEVAKPEQTNIFTQPQETQSKPEKPKSSAFVGPKKTEQKKDSDVKVPSVKTVKIAKAIPPKKDTPEIKPTRLSTKPAQPSEKPERNLFKINLYSMPVKNEKKTEIDARDNPLTEKSLKALKKVLGKILYHADKLGVRPYDAITLFFIESGFNPNKYGVINEKKNIYARGIGMITESTAIEINKMCRKNGRLPIFSEKWGRITNIKELYNPDKNIEASLVYFKAALEDNGGNARKAYAAYYGGAGWKNSENQDKYADGMARFEKHNDVYKKVNFAMLNQSDVSAEDFKKNHIDPYFIAK